MRPKVSIILCSYNQAAYLSEAVRSVLAQGFQDWELLLLDNGSTDHSARIAKELAPDSRIRLFLHPENRPITLRFNEGIRAARAPYISFLYSDDLYLPDKLERQLALFRPLSEKFGVVYAPSRFRNQKSGREWNAPGSRWSGPALEKLLLRRKSNYPDMISPLTRRECFLRHPFDENIFAEGEAIFLRIAITHSFCMDPNPVAISRDTGQNRGRAIPVNVQYHLASLEKLRGDPAFDESRFGRAVRKHQALLWRDNAYAYARMGGDNSWVVSALRQAGVLWSGSRLHPRWALAWCLGHSGQKVRDFINGAGDWTKSAPRLRGTVSGYGGSSGN